MGYQALYRQYRPQRFGEIKGQDHISLTLKNSLTSGRISHAYLFCGPRGTGKTSTAKILAKGVNCPNQQNGEPCNFCHNCKSITDGSSMDVLEIDAASNRGIDEIRELRDKISFSPVEGSYKVYIIDEVHMLTTEAFNALLKTLEEPPSHAIFILATTDPRKIPATILSRCQRFDFRQISIEVIMEVLKNVGEGTGAEIEEGAYYLMARQAEGGLRDALGLLDQALAGGAKEISLKEVASLLGAVEDELLLKWHQLISQGKIGEALFFLNQLLLDGRELGQIIADLSLFYRNLLLLSLGGKAEEIVAASPEIKDRLLKVVNKTSQNQLVELIKILNNLEGEIRWTNQRRILVELGIIKLAEVCKTSFPKEEPKIPARPKEIKAKSVIEKEVSKREVKKAPLSKEKEAKRTEEIPKKPVIEKEEQKEPEAPVAIDLSTVKTSWEDFLSVLRRKTNVSYSAFLREGELTSIEGQNLSLAFQPSHKFHKEQVEKPEVKNQIEGVLAQYFKTPLRITCFIGEERQEKIEENNSLPQEAQAMFGGRLVDLEDE